jgi:hypothetical protein
MVFFSARTIKFSLAFVIQGHVKNQCHLLIVDFNFFYHKTDKYVVTSFYFLLEGCSPKLLFNHKIPTNTTLGFFSANVTGSNSDNKVSVVDAD